MKKPKRHHRRWKEQELEALSIAVEMEESYKKVAKDLHRTPKTTATMMSKMRKQMNNKVATPDMIIDDAGIVETATEKVAKSHNYKFCPHCGKEL